MYHFSEAFTATVTIELGWCSSSQLIHDDHVCIRPVGQ